MINEKNIQGRRHFLRWLLILPLLIFGYLYKKFQINLKQKIPSLKIKLIELNSGITHKNGLYILKERDYYSVFSRKCPHLGCTVEFYQNKNEFICPCHGSHFSSEGKYTSGPAKRDLYKHPYIEAENMLEIDINETI